MWVFLLRIKKGQVFLGEDFNFKELFDNFENHYKQACLFFEIEQNKSTSSVIVESGSERRLR